MGWAQVGRRRRPRVEPQLAHTSSPRLRNLATVYRAGPPTPRGPGEEGEPGRQGGAECCPSASAACSFPLSPGGEGRWCSELVCRPAGSCMRHVEACVRAFVCPPALPSPTGKHRACEHRPAPSPSADLHSETALCVFLPSTFGELKTVRLPKKMTGTGAHRGFGFVDFLTKQDAKVRGPYPPASPFWAFCRRSSGVLWFLFFAPPNPANLHGVLGRKGPGFVFGERHSSVSPYVSMQGPGVRSGPVSGLPGLPGQRESVCSCTPMGSRDALQNAEGLRGSS